MSNKMPTTQTLPIGPGHAVTTPGTSRGHPTNASFTGHADLARSGAEKKLTPPTPYPHQHVVTAPGGEKLIAHGISKTEAAVRLDSKTPTFDGGIPKPHLGGDNVPIHDGMDPRYDRGDHIEGLGREVLDQAVRSGSHISSADCPPKK